MIPACARCRREGVETRPVWGPIKALASVALAFMHGGLWAHEELSKDYCALCRRVVTLTALGVSIVILAAAAVGVALWLKGPRGGGAR